MLDFSGVLDAPAPGLPAASDGAEPQGSFHYECFDSEGHLLWEETDHNLFTTLAKNAMISGQYVASSTLVGPYMGLISSASFTAVSAADTQASHAGWLECNATNAPNYTGSRQTAVYGAPSGGVSSCSPLSFVFSNSGTVQGVAVIAGSGAVVTNTSTLGVLMNASALTTARSVLSGDTLAITHSITLT